VTRTVIINNTFTKVGNLTVVVNFKAIYQHLIGYIKIIQGKPHTA